jgi:hypothetical protein
MVFLVPVVTSIPVVATVPIMIAIVRIPVHLVIVGISITRINSAAIVGIRILAAN